VLWQISQLSWQQVTAQQQTEALLAPWVTDLQTPSLAALNTVSSAVGILMALRSASQMQSTFLFHARTAFPMPLDTLTITAGQEIAPLINVVRVVGSALRRPSTLQSCAWVGVKLFSKDTLTQWTSHAVQVFLGQLVPITVKLIQDLRAVRPMIAQSGAILNALKVTATVLQTHAA